MIQFTTAAILIIAGFTAPAFAQKHATDTAATRVAQAPPVGNAPLSDGEVRRIDKDTKKLTLRHGPIQSLDMPPMTMVFQVKDPAMLDTVKVGDKIRFSVERLGGALTITEMEAAK